MNTFFCPNCFTYTRTDAIEYMCAGRGCGRRSIRTTEGEILPLGARAVLPYTPYNTVATQTRNFTQQQIAAYARATEPRDGAVDLVRIDRTNANNYYIPQDPLAAPPPVAKRPPISARLRCNKCNYTWVKAWLTDDPATMPRCPNCTSTNVRTTAQTWLRWCTQCAVQTDSISKDCVYCRTPTMQAFILKPFTPSLRNAWANS